MGLTKRLFTNTKIIILLIFLLLSIVAIHPRTADGVAIRGVAKESSAFLSGIANPKPTASPVARELILSVNNVKIHSVEDYFEALKNVSANATVIIETDKQAYRVTAEYKKKVITLNETEKETQIKTVYNETLKQYINVTTIVEKPKKQTIYLTNEPVDLGITVQEAPTTNIRKGLDLQGGTRVLLQPAEKISSEMLDTLIANMEQRLNVYGVSDVSLRPVVDFDGNQFIVVEIAGTTEEEIKNLLATQGKFEAKVGDTVVFSGGNDITYVCRTAQCSGIDPQAGCNAGQGGNYCRFFFTIALSPEAAQRQADATSKLEVIQEQGQEQYLSKKLDLFLDDTLVDSLSIGSDLKGRAVSDISISGSGFGTQLEDARQDALGNMKKLQTVLVTGSLPVKLDIVKVDAISPTLGNEFSKSILIMTILASLGVILVIYLKYRKAFITVPIAVTLLGEVVIILGAAALIGWNIDLAAIAGIIVAVGTGVDDQIVITDETLRGEKEVAIGWKQKLQKAFFIIIAAYFATVASMIPLLFAGAGLLKGFAITTILGVSIGVFITRPAYAAMIELILKEKERRE